MPMVVYTEDEVISQCEKAEADGAARSAAALTSSRTAAQTLYRLLMDIDTTICAHGKVEIGTPLQSRIQDVLARSHEHFNS
jgi:hypothetical protein